MQASINHDRGMVPTGFTAGFNENQDKEKPSNKDKRETPAVTGVFIRELPERIVELYWQSFVTQEALHQRPRSRLRQPETRAGSL